MARILIKVYANKGDFVFINNYVNITCSCVYPIADSVMGLLCDQANSSSLPFNIKGFATEDEMVSELMVLSNTTQMNTCFRSGAGV